MNSVLEDLAKRGAKILSDTKTPRQSKKKQIPIPMIDNRDPHNKFIEKVIKEKPKPKVLLEFFERTIEQEEAKL